jgi:NhaA family Na+:H+ antiporter
MGERLRYVFRHFPNEEAHPGSELVAIGSEAAARQGRFWEMYDALWRSAPPLDQAALLKIAADIGLELERFKRDLKDPALRRRVEEDMAEGRLRGVTATPTIFVDEQRYDGAWEFQSMLQGIDQPMGQAIGRTARAFANLPSSAAMVLLFAGALALVLANGPFAPVYHKLMDAQIAVGIASNPVTLSFGGWCSEGLLAVFYFVLGLEIRRETATGSATGLRATLMPLLAAVGGVVVPALIFLALNGQAARVGWPVPTDTGLAFTLAVLALFGTRASAGLKAFVAIYGVANDVLSILILAVFYPHSIRPEWLIGAAAAIALLAILRRWQVYAAWPYIFTVVGLWLSLHEAGVSGALSGIVLAAFLPPRPTPDATPLLAQAATALAALEHAEHALRRANSHRRLKEEPVWDWASRNLAAASDRLLSPAERAERAAEPWSTYLILPLFAFSAAGATLAGDFVTADAWRVVAGVALGLFVGKPVGIVLTSWAASKLRIAAPPAATPPLAFVGAAILCGIGDPFEFLMADQAFGKTPLADAAKIGVLAGSLLAAAVGAAVFAFAQPVHQIEKKTMQGRGS